jgi:Ca2+-binding EF-hand superfamily protein
MAAMLPNQADELGELFDLVDVDKSGSIEDTELYALIRLSKPSMSYEDMKLTFNSIDGDKGNSLDKKEFCAHFIEQWKDVDAEAFHARVELTKKLAERKPVLGQLFDHFDIDGNGFLDRGEIYHMVVLSRPNYTNDDLTTLMAKIDINHDRKLDKGEFVQYYFQLHKDENELEFNDRIDATLMGRRGHKLRSVFNAYDRDGNGTLDVNEFARLLRMNGRKFVSADVILDTLTKIDQDNDRKITFKEWLEHMSGMIAMMDDAKFNKAISNMLSAVNESGDSKA